MKPFLVTSGEPAGIGPDICLSLVNSNLPVVVVADIEMLQERNKLIGKKVKFHEYLPEKEINQPDSLCVLNLPCREKVKPGILNAANSPYVIEMLSLAAKRTLAQEFSAVITAPVHKGIISAAGINFIGHTEFFADYCGIDKVVMMLASPIMRVALLTTHIPLCKVAESIDEDNLIKVIKIIHYSLQKNYGITKPKILVAGLNPHAGENGYIGREEIDIIIPTLEKLRKEGMNLIGPLSADTMFSETNIENADIFLVMYHDQGLPVLKYSGFSESINVTLGLPIIRTSVDHGTALTLAGSGMANTSSLHYALKAAAVMAESKI